MPLTPDEANDLRIEFLFRSFLKRLKETVRPRENLAEQFSLSPVLVWVFSSALVFVALASTPEYITPLAGHSGDRILDALLRAGK